MYGGEGYQLFAFPMLHCSFIASQARPLHLFSPHELEEGAWLVALAYWSKANLCSADLANHTPSVVTGYAM